ncbi:MAG: hypothetical protein A2X59_12855 [Nitrospirae bacterium GWC2_42_7]|nr:MAG: hypothetical protein A2X59_12855 [Nitrospirae bacterium GWC2_42_7]
MQFIIGGKSIELNTLEPGLDKKFISLHSAYFGHEALSWDDFEVEAIKFFDSCSSKIALHDAYFNNFTVIWDTFISAGKFAEAENIWDMALKPALKWEKTNQAKRIHKGTPYYFWGITVLQRGELDKGYALIHRAVEEDFLTHGKAYIDTSGFALVSLNYVKADQAFRQWVIQQAKFLNTMQNNYSALYGRKFILEDFKDRFLLAPPNVATIFLLAYAVARLMRLSELPAHAFHSSFAGQLEINILFDVVLVIDNAIHAKNPSQRKFINHAEFLLTKANFSLNNAQLGDINEAYNKDFDGTLRTILDGTFSLPNLTLTTFQRDVAIVYGLRNYGAHNVSSVPTIQERFLEIQQVVMNVLFATVDFLY